MGFVLTVVFALLAWIVLWAIGAKAIDAFLVTVVVTLLAATARMLARQFSRRDAR